MKDKNKKGKRSHRGMKYTWIEKIREKLNFGKKSKRKKKGGIPHAIIKAQVWPSGYTPEPEIASPRPFREPAWMQQL